jgi:hypothetical protein
MKPTFQCSRHTAPARRKSSALPQHVLRLKQLMLQYQHDCGGTRPLTLHPEGQAKHGLLMAPITPRFGDHSAHRNPSRTIASTLLLTVGGRRCAECSARRQSGRLGRSMPPYFAHCPADPLRHARCPAVGETSGNHWCDATPPA